MNIRGWGREHQAAKSLITKSNDCDILSINETWIKDDNDSINIEGYQWYGHRRRTVNRRAVKGFGGVGVLVANHLFPLYDIEITDKSIDGILALSLSNKVTNYKLMLITVYLPPDNSIYGRDSSMFFSHLTSLIYLTSDYDAVYVAGDLNGRIWNRLDFIEPLDDVPTRTAIDQSVKGHGEAILDFCHETKFCVINGRISPLNDNYTSISTKGTAVVDYFLTSHENLKNVQHFMVMTISSLVDSLGAHIVATSPNKISDHSMLIMDIHVKDNDLPDISFGDDNHPDHRLYGPETSARHSPTLPPRFKVHNIPCDFMSSPEARENILSIIDMIEQSRTSQREINGIYDSIVDIYINEMRRTFGTKNNTPHCHRKFRHTQKEWWDEELTELFRDMQKAEHNFIKAKRNKHKFKEMQSIFKCKQKPFDRIVKNKQRTCQRN